MKKLICIVLSLVLCLGCAGCGSTPAEQETVAVTEAVVETTAETTPEEMIPVLQEPADQLPRKPMYNFTSWDTEGNETGDLEVYDCRMYPTDNGTTIFAMDYKAVEGLQMVIFGYADDGNDDPNYWVETEDLTTGKVATYVFEVENEVLDLIYHPGMFFRDQYGFDVAIIEIFHREEDIYATAGNPIGEAEQLLFSKEGKIKVHSASMQQLDNGYVRLTLECTPGKDLYYCFYTNPDEEGNQVVRYGGLTSGKQEIIVADIWAEYVEGLHNFNFSFYEPNEYPEARIYLSSPITEFNELDASQFAAFIGGGKLALLYYGVIDEAVMGATLTAEDGTSVEITESITDKNGDGNSLLWFKEYKAKSGDMISVILSKEGYEDLSLELYVH